MQLLVDFCTTAKLFIDLSVHNVNMYIHSKFERVKINLWILRIYGP